MASTFKLGNNKQSSTLRNRSIFIAVFIGIALSVLAYTLITTKLNGDQATVNDAAQIETAKQRVSEESENVANPEKAPSNVSDETSDQVPTSDDLSISITRHTQSDGAVKASAQAEGSTDGKCVFSYTTESDRPVVRETTLEDNTCSVEIPEVEFTKLGSWNLNVTFYANNSKVEVNQSVTIN